MRRRMEMLDQHEKFCEESELGAEAKVFSSERSGFDDSASHELQNCKTR